jgi:hypothetical protein
MPDKRRNADRRYGHRFSLKYFLFGGRRTALRRASDRQGIKFVDEYSPALMGMIILLLILSIVDGVMSLHLLELGVQEINPIMSLCLEVSPWFFLASKFLLTCFGVMSLLVVSSSYVFDNRIRVRDVFPAILFLYFMLTIWNSYLVLNV